MNKTFTLSSVGQNPENFSCSLSKTEFIPPNHQIALLNMSVDAHSGSGHHYVSPQSSYSLDTQTATISVPNPVNINAVNAGLNGVPYVAMSSYRPAGTGFADTTTGQINSAGDGAVFVGTAPVAVSSYFVLNVIMIQGASVPSASAPSAQYIRILTFRGTSAAALNSWTSIVNVGSLNGMSYTNPNAGYGDLSSLGTTFTVMSSGSTPQNQVNNGLIELQTGTFTNNKGITWEFNTSGGATSLTTTFTNYSGSNNHTYLATLSNGTTFYLTRTSFRNYTHHSTDGAVSALTAVINDGVNPHILTLSNGDTYTASGLWTLNTPSNVANGSLPRAEFFVSLDNLPIENHLSNNTLQSIVPSVYTHHNRFDSETDESIVPHHLIYHKLNNKGHLRIGKIDVSIRDNITGDILHNTTLNISTNLTLHIKPI